MTDHIQQTIELLEHEIEALEQRSGELGRVIEALRPLAGGEEQPARTIRRSPAKAKAGRKAKKIGTRALKNRPTDRPTEQKAGRRSLPSSAEPP